MMLSSNLNHRAIVIDCPLTVLHRLPKKISAQLIKGTPSQNIDFSSIKHLDLSDLALRTIPTFVHECTNMTCLDLRNNQLVTPPDRELSHLSKLNKILTEGNHFATAMTGSQLMHRLQDLTNVDDV